MKSKIIKKVLSGILSVSLMLQMGMPAVYAEESNPIQETKNITAFADLAEEVKNITVPVGTMEEELPLPKIVTATLERTVYEKVTVDSSNLPEEESDKAETTEPVESQAPESGNPVDTSADSNAAENDSESGNTVETPAAAEEINTTTSLPLDTPSLNSGSTEEIEPKTELVEKKITENVELAVTWESDKPFSSETADTFTYTAKLTDESYTLSEGVEMPKITVLLVDENAVASMTIGNMTSESQKSETVNNLKITSPDGNFETSQDNGGLIKITSGGSYTLSMDGAASSSTGIFIEASNGTVNLILDGITVETANECLKAKGKYLQISVDLNGKASSLTYTGSELEKYFGTSTVVKMEVTDSKGGGSLAINGGLFVDGYSSTPGNITFTKGKITIDPKGNTIGIQGMANKFGTVSIDGADVIIPKEVDSHGGKVFSSQNISINAGSFTWEGADVGNFNTSDGVMLLSLNGGTVKVGKLSTQFHQINGGVLNGDIADPNIKIKGGRINGSVTGYTNIQLPYQAGEKISIENTFWAYKGELTTQEWNASDSEKTDGKITLWIRNGYDQKITIDSTAYEYKWDSVTSKFASTAGATVKIASDLSYNAAPLPQGYTNPPKFSITAEKTDLAKLTDTIGYQWYENNQKIPSATEASYTIPIGKVAGEYTYYCNVTCGDYSIYSSIAKVKIVDAVACVVINGNNSYYDNLDSAFEAVPQGGKSTITLLKDIDLGTSYVPSNGIIKGDITLNLNNKTLSGSGNYVIFRRDTGNYPFTITGAGMIKYSGSSASGGAIMYFLSQSNGKLTIEDKVQIVATSSRAVYLGHGADLQLTGNVKLITSSGSHLIYAQENGSNIIIDGGTLENNTNKEIILNDGGNVFINKIGVIMKDGIVKASNICFNVANDGVSATGNTWYRINADGLQSNKMEFTEGDNTTTYDNLLYGKKDETVSFTATAKAGYVISDIASVTKGSTALSVTKTQGDYTSAQNTCTFSFTMPSDDGVAISVPVKLENCFKLVGENISRAYDGTAFEVPTTKGKHFTWSGTGNANIEGYYMDNTGSTKTNEANSGATTNGGAPKTAGTYYAKVRVLADDDYASTIGYVPFTITQSGTTFDGGIKTYKGDTATNIFNYGDTITIKVTPKATGTKPVTNGLKMARSFSAPTLNQMALFVGETQITEPQQVTSGQELTFTYDTKGTSVITPNTPVEITTKYVGNDNMANLEQGVKITVNAVAEVTKGSTVSYACTLQEVFDFIGNGETGTIKILKDIDLGENGVNQTGGSTVTFDLNGCTVKHSKNDSSAITIYSSDITKLTVKSSIDGGTLLESGGNSKAINNAIGKGEVIIESGLIRNTGSVGGKAIYNANKLTVNGGILDTLKNGCSIMNAENPAILEVNGGIVKSVSEAIFNKYGTVSINGGTVLGKVAIDNGASGTVNYAKGIILGDCTGDGTYTEGNPQWLAKGTATLLIDAEIPSSKTFTVSKDANFMIKEGTTLTNNGTLVLNGKLNGTGTLSGTGEFKTNVFTADDIQPIQDQTYTGNVIEPEITINPSIMGKKFNVDLTDYTKAYENNINVGVAKVVFTDKIDNSNKVEKNFNIVKSGTTFDGGIKTYKDNTETNTFNYGDTITVKVTPKATGTAPVTKSLRMARSFSAPTTNQMALFVGEKQITEAVNVADGSYTITYDTKAKDLVSGNNTITAKYVGNSTMVDYSENVIVTLNKKAITSAVVNTSDASASKEYDGTNSFTNVTLTTLTGVESGDTVKATVYGTVIDVNVGTDKALTTTSVTLDGDDKNYYSLDKATVSGNVAITQASTTGIDQELQAVKGLAKEYTFDLNKLLPEFSTGKSFGYIIYTVGTVTNTDKVLSQAPSISDIKGGKITLKVANVADKDKTAAIQIKVVSKNYKDFTANLNVKTIDKTPLSIEAVFTGGTYNGKPYAYTGTPIFKNDAETVSGITYTAKYAGRDGTIYDESETAPANAGKYNLILTVSGKSANTYAGTTTIGFEITKKQINAKPNNVSIESNASFPAYTWSINTGITGENITAANAQNVAMQAQENSTKLTAVKVGTFDIVFTTAPNFNQKGDTEKNYDIQIGKGTLTVTKYNSHEDSSNDGGSSNGGGSYYNGNKDNGTTVITPPVTPDKPNLPTQTTTTVPSTVKNGTANVIVSQSTVESAISKAQAEAKKKGTEKNGIAVEIKVDTKNSIVNSLYVNLPKTSVDKLLKAEAKAVYINSDTASINMNLETLKTIQKEINDDINVSAKRLDNGILSAEVKAIVGNHPVFDFTITGKNGKKVTNFGKGKVSVSIPYTLGSKEKAGNVVAYYIDNIGKVHEVPNSVYDEQSKTLMFVTNHFSKFSVGYKADKVTTFTDISNHWAKEVIEFATAREMFRETEKGKFSPNVSITRGMFVTALGRLAEVNVSDYKTTKFTDVKADSYYLPYIEWASKNGILKGTSATTFAPDQSITREQMAVIMTNYSKTMGFELPKVHAENIFADNGKIGNYAKTAVKQMQMAGVLVGKNGNKLDPQGTATRAEGSAVLKRFVEIVIKSNTADGWMQNDNGRWLYYKNGKALTGKHTIDGVSYEFNSYGETTTEPSFTFKTYIVQKGDCLRSIAQKYKVNIFTMAKVNNKDILSILHVGDVLKIPQK